MALSDLLAQLRTTVGFLGERDQYGWWPSSFVSAGSKPFLAPVFSRTMLLAQCVGVTQAAALVHDERIGVGRVFHLFRLPEDLEQGIQRTLRDPQFARRTAPHLATSTAALTYLHDLAQSAAVDSVGPTRIGSADAITNPATWQLVAAHYARAFTAGAQVYPYVTERA